jgi:predicted transcriptional regulator
MSTSTLEATEKDPAKLVQINLTVSQEVADALEELASRQQITKTDVMRKAITLLAVADAAKRRNERMGLFDANRKLTIEIFGV